MLVDKSEQSTPHFSLSSWTDIHFPALANNWTGGAPLKKPKIATQGLHPVDHDWSRLSWLGHTLG